MPLCFSPIASGPSGLSPAVSRRECRLSPFVAASLVSPERCAFIFELVLRGSSPSLRRGPAEIPLRSPPRRRRSQGLRPGEASFAGRPRLVSRAFRLERVRSIFRFLSPNWSLSFRLVGCACRRAFPVSRGRVDSVRVSDARLIYRAVGECPCPRTPSPGSVSYQAALKLLTSPFGFLVREMSSVVLPQNSTGLSKGVIATSEACSSICATGIRFGVSSTSRQGPSSLFRLSSTSVNSGGMSSSSQPG